MSDVPDEPNGGDRVTARDVLAYARPFAGALVAGGLLSLATSATGLALPLVVRALVGALGDGGSVATLLLLMTALVVANAAIGAVGSYVLERTGESVVLALRQRLLARLLRLRLTAVDAAEPGDLMARITSDTTQVRAVATQAMVSAVTASLTLVATLVLMGVVDLPLLAVTLAVLVVAAIVIGGVVPRINRAARQAQDSVGTMGAALERAFGAFRTVKASGAEQREEQRVQAAAQEAWQAGVRAAKWSALAGNIAGLAVQMSFLAVLTVGGGRVASGAIDVGTLIAFLLYVYYLMPPIGALTSAVTEYQTGTAALARILEAERLPVEHSDGLASPPDVRGPVSVTFDDVYFRYTAEPPDVHRGVRFVVPPGGMTALVGPSGAGKTTVFSLIERFYEPRSGRVAVDDIDVSAWPLATLRATIGYVEQDAPVLSGTLRENLLFAMPEADHRRVMQVVATARLDGLVARLPDGLDTLVGHRGTRLSGGERQRVAIARALLRGPRLLLLDEATSQLDAINEAALRDTIADVAATTTVLVVAHRLSTVTMADRIIVMDEGRVRAIGTHAQLIDADALYRELAATQLLTVSE